MLGVRNRQVGWELEGRTKAEETNRVDIDFSFNTNISD